MTNCAQLDNFCAFIFSYPCTSVARTSVACTSVACTSVACTSAACTKVAYTSAACTSVACTSAACTSAACTSAACTSVVRFKMMLICICYFNAAEVHNLLIAIILIYEEQHLSWPYMTWKLYVFKTCKFQNSQKNICKEFIWRYYWTELICLINIPCVRFNACMTQKKNNRHCMIVLVVFRLNLCWFEVYQCGVSTLA